MKCWKGARFLKTLVLLIGSISFSVASAKKDKDDVYYIATPERIEAFMEAFSTFKAPSAYESGTPHKEIVEKTTQQIRLLRRYRFEEVAQAFMAAFLEEVTHLDKLGSANKLDESSVELWFFAEIATAMRHVGHVGDWSDFETLTEELLEIMKYIANKVGDSYVEANEAAFSEYGERLKAAKRNMKSTNMARQEGFDEDGIPRLATGKYFLRSKAVDIHGKVAAGSMVELVDYTYAESLGFKWIDKVRERMEKVLKGQPEVLDAFLDFEFRRVRQSTKGPNKLWMLGLPGTGKDTAVEAYVDAIHGYKDAGLHHMFRLGPFRTEADAWEAFGSKPGYIGSDKVSAFVRFATDHSGGRYKVEKFQSITGAPAERVVDGDGKGFPASSGVIFVNELHNWSRAAIDLVLKEFLEKGTIRVSNANDGHKSIKVPLTIVVASNDGMDLLLPPGHKKGQSLSYEELIELWQQNRSDPKRIREEVLKKNTLLRGEVRDEKAGISPEVLDRFSDDELFLMRPLSRDTLKDIIKLALDDLAEDYSLARKLLGPIQFEFEESVVNRIAEFQYSAENGARLLSGRVRSFVERELDRAFKDKKLGKSSDPRTIHVNIDEKSDGTWCLTFTHSIKGELDPDWKVEQNIAATEVLRHLEPLSDKEIQRIMEFEDFMRERIVGSASIAPRLTEALLLSRNAGHAKADARARRFLFLGLSSTGKSQAAKEIDRFFNGDRERLYTVDFNGIISEHQVRERIFGLPGEGPSEFMKAYDRSNGRMIVLLDEIANVPDVGILNPLYSIFDEARPDQFNDGRERAMANVVIIGTGNAGEEIFKGIPRTLPEQQQRAAMQEIYNKFVANPARQRAFLEGQFRQAFLNRIGAENISFFAPLDFQGVRELIQIKLKDVLETFESGGGRSYRVRFKDEEAFEKALDVFELEGFNLWEQGRSVERYVVDHFYSRLLLLLQSHFVPSDVTVALEYRERVTEGRGDKKRTYELFDVHVEGQAEVLKLRLDARKQVDHPETTAEHQIQVAFHEAGHEIARQALFGDVTDPEKISIIPGVAEIGGQYIAYSGIAVHKPKIHNDSTREGIVARVAELIAGGEAQRLLNKGHKSDAGQSNDLERANTLARRMIVQWGLIPGWGMQTSETCQDMDSFMASLSPERKSQLDKEIQKILKEAKSMAHLVLAMNYEAFVELGVKLAKEGVVYKRDIEGVYAEHPVIDYWEHKKDNVVKRGARVLSWDFLKTWVLGSLPHRGRDLERVSSVPEIAAEDVADIDEILEALRQKSLSEARPMEPAPILEESERNLFPSLDTSCSSHLKAS